MRFLLSMIAGLVLVGAAPIAAAEAAPGAYLASSTAAAGAAPAHAGAVGPVGRANASFGAGPASGTKLDGRPYFAYQASPGGSIEDHIAIINFATHAQTLNVYPVDAVSGVNGAFTYPPRAVRPVQVGAWLSVGVIRAGEVTVAPRTVEILPIYLHVPANAGPGDHAGAVIVSLTALVKGKHGQLVKFEQRIATKVIIRVSGPLHPRLAIENMRASYSGHLDPFASGVVSITYTVRNTGNAILGGTQQVSVHGLFGSTAPGPALPAVPPLLPGGSITFSTRVHGVPPEISVTATVRLSPEGLRGDINPGIRIATASVTLWAVPWMLVVLVVIVLFALAALIWRRRRRSPVRSGVTASRTPEGVKP
jgi:hypothetical protein